MPEVWLVYFLFLDRLDGWFNSLRFRDHLLHQDLRVIWHNISVHNRSKRNMVAGWLDVLIHQLSEVFSAETVHQICGLAICASHFTCQNLCVLQGLVIDGPARDGWTTLGNGSLKQPWVGREQQQAVNLHIYIHSICLGRLMIG